MRPTRAGSGRSAPISSISRNPSKCLVADAVAAKKEDGHRNLQRPTRYQCIMPAQAESDRLRLEADTILTRYQQVQQALEHARGEDGDHWETGELTVTLDTPQGDPIEVTLDLDSDPASNAQARYERAKEHDSLVAPTELDELDEMGISSIRFGHGSVPFSIPQAPSISSPSRWTNRVADAPSAPS